MVQGAGYAGHLYRNNMIFTFPRRGCDLMSGNPVACESSNMSFQTCLSGLGPVLDSPYPERHSMFTHTDLAQERE